ncbi:trypsin-like peptidase domain-containing protein [Sorangium sp. So ce185]|uniref:trypsin-like peptidase domain-containing protein n=1 Tax=Sorangium sp. So ce185 TaxID=3133287 RepID=UPI003F646AE5
MLHRLKQAVARVEVDGKPNGTAFLIDPEHVVTAHHVLLGQKAVTLRFAEWSAASPDVSLTGNDDGVRSCQLSWQPANGADLAVLKLDRRCPLNVAALSLGALPEVDAEWSTFGYPRGVPGGHRLAGGKVRDPGKLVEPLTYRFLQLETSAARERLSGYSGGPCVVDGLVVGVLTSQLTRFAQDIEPSMSASAGGPATAMTRCPSLDTLYALPVDLLREWRSTIRLVPHVSSTAAFCVPFTRPRLLGRESLLKSIHDLLSRRSGAGPLPVLVGPGGIGKTQLAVLYAHTYADEYAGGVFWLDGSQDLQSIVAQLGSYALRTGLAAPHPSGAGPDYYAQLAALWLGRFGSRRDVLLIVDDVADSSFLVQQVRGATTWTFRSLAATVLATSRRRGIVGATDVDLVTLSEHDAEELLRREAGRSASDWDGPAARAIVTALGALPLAIRLAGGYLKRREAVAMSDLAAVLHRAGVDAPLEDVVVLEDYPTTLRGGIATVLAATLDDPADSVASRLLSVLACFPRGQPIQVRTLAWLVDGRRNLGADASGAIDAQLETLRSVNILDATESGELRLHAVIHTVRRAQLTHRFRRRVSRRLVGRLFEPRLLARQSGASLLSVFRDLAALERMLDEDPLSAQIAALRRVLGRAAHLLEGPASPLPILHRQALLMRETALARVFDCSASLRGEPWLRLRWSTRTTDRAEVRVLADPFVGTRACSLSADGELLSIGDGGGGVELYRPRTGLRVARTVHGGAVLCVATSASGEVVASGGTDRVARIWDVQSGAMRLAFHAHEHTVLGVALDGAGALAVSCGLDRSVRSWTTEDGTRLSLWIHNEPVISCAVSDDGRVAVAGTMDGILRVFDPRTGEELERDRPETKPRLVQTTLSPDGRFVLSGWANGALHLWDRIAGSRTLLQAPFTRYDCAISSCALSDDGSIAIAGTVDRTIRAWRTKDKRQFAVISGLIEAARSCALARDGDMIVAAAGDLRVWSLLAAGESAVAPVHRGSVRLSSISGDGRTGLTCGGDAKARLWDVVRGAPTYELPVGDLDDRPLACALARGGRIAITSARNPGNGAAMVVEYKLPSGERRRIVRDVHFEEGLTRLWNTRTGVCSRMLTKAHHDWVRAVAISAEGRHIVTVSRDSQPTLWEFPSGNHRIIAETDDTFVGQCCALSDDAGVLLIGGEDGRVMVWDVRTGEVLRALDRHQSCVTACSLSTSGEVAVSTSADGIIRVWEVQTGRCTRELSRPGVRGCALSVDAALLLVYGSGVMSILRAATAEPVVELPIENIVACSMNEDAGVFLVGDAAGHVSVFDRVTPPLAQGLLSKALSALSSLVKR